MNAAVTVFLFCLACAATVFAGPNPVEDGRRQFNTRCAGCHGRSGSGSTAPTLIKSDGTTKSTVPCLAPCVNDNNVMALHSPFATVMWDYINRAMPIGKEGSLKPDEVYALSAFLLFKNGVIREDETMDAQSLPKVVMPNRQGYALPAQPWKHGAPRLLNYP